MGRFVGGQFIEPHQTRAGGKRGQDGKQHEQQDGKEPMMREPVQTTAGGQRGSGEGLGGRLENSSWSGLGHGCRNGVLTAEVNFSLARRPGVYQRWRALWYRGELTDAILCRSGGNWAG